MNCYDFQCKKCEIVYEARTSYDETGKYKNVQCPKCKSKRKTKLPSCGIGHNFTDPVGTDRWMSEDKGHDYRYNYNLPNEKKMRANAEKKSHVGPTPYRNIDDITSGKYFGPAR